ncbi:hypothetical protein MRX96_054058 [Rhipicephalus microplus]
MAQSLWYIPFAQLETSLPSLMFDNEVAVDVTCHNCLKQLLALTELKKIPVTARQPADRRTSMGFLHVVDGDAADENLLSGLQSAVRSCRHPGKAAPSRCASRAQFPQTT